MGKDSEWDVRRAAARSLEQIELGAAFDDELSLREGAIRLRGLRPGRRMEILMQIHDLGTLRKLVDALCRLTLEEAPSGQGS